jgi:iron complex transport system substrate-binding protein
MFSISQIPKLIVILTASIILLSACAPAATPTLQPTPLPSPTPASLTFTDDLGRTITLEAPAQRIVTLGASIVESLFALGAGEQIVGREEFSLYPVEAQSIPSVGSLFGNLPSETILAMEPDLVIAPEIISVEQVQALENLNLTVYYQKNPTTFDELYTNLSDLAALTGHTREAETLNRDLAMRVEAIVNTLAAVETRPKVFYELDATDPENPYTTGAGTFIDTLISMAGGENIGAALEGAYAQISSEQVINANPEVILLADADYGVTPEIVAARAGWADISAITNGRVFPFDPNLGSVPGPRLVDGLEYMARTFHPDLFQE